MRVKNIGILILIVGLFAGCKAKNGSVIISADDLSDSLRTVIIMHPTVNNIKTVQYLVQNDILSIPQNYRIVGVYHINEVYNYTQSKKYIEQQHLANFSLLPIYGKLYSAILYSKNNCSETFDKIFKGSRAIFFFGGPDIPPKCYGESTSLLTNITDPNRHYMELSFLFHLLGGNQDTLFIPLLNQNPNYTILGICLGMQSINVATGGTLYQDIPQEIYGLKTVEEVLLQKSNDQHRNYFTNYSIDDKLIWGSFHQVNFVREPFISMTSSYNVKPYVLSSHHQCVKKLGCNIQVAGLSMDGKIIEAITNAKFPNVIGVQFHPEPSLLYMPNDTLHLVPNQTSNSSYINLFGDEGGMTFHKSFWKFFGEKLK